MIPNPEVAHQISKLPDSNLTSQDTQYSTFQTEPTGNGRCPLQFPHGRKAEETISVPTPAQDSQTRERQRQGNWTSRPFPPLGSRHPTELGGAEETGEGSAFSLLPGGLF